MTEVDGIMPEATTQPISSTHAITEEHSVPSSSDYTDANASAVVSNDEQQQLKEQNGLNKINNSRVSTDVDMRNEQMDVDGADTEEEDDSQMTASSTTENGRGVDGGGGEDSKMSTGEDDGNAAHVEEEKRLNNDTKVDGLIVPMVASLKDKSRSFCNDELQKRGFVLSHIIGSSGSLRSHELYESDNLSRTIFFHITFSNSYTFHVRSA